VKKIKWVAGILVGLICTVVLLGIWISQSTATTHPSTLASLGTPSSVDAMELSLNESQQVMLNTIKAADWQVPLSGLLNLDHPKAKAAGLEDHSEHIQVYAFHIKHPVYGDYLVDTGVSELFAKTPVEAGVASWLVSQMGMEHLVLTTSTDQYLATLDHSIKGVFLTHLHMDHISGLTAIPKDTPLFIGAYEATSPYFLYAATAGSVDRMLMGRPALQEWGAKIVDIFGDASVFAIHSPGHTSGSTAYLVNATNGPVLLTGDASHTTWGWEHEVEPGSFSVDMDESRDSLLFLTNFVRQHSEIEVKVGHQ
jgi:glyoxylase-like metal-dependent hydrolase (beta-lactamase superfamily II)